MRWLISGGRWVAIFAVGFSTGYALVATLVPEAADGQNVAQETTAATPVGVTMGELTSLPTEPAMQGDAPDVVPSQTHAAPKLAATQRALEAKTVFPAGDSPPHKAGLGIPAGEVDLSAQRPWWDRCRHQKCRVEFGDIEGGLLIRKGALRHGVTLDWGKTFAAAPRIDVLPTEPGIEIELRAVALDVHGKPAAAEIIWDQGEKRIAGVIALDLGATGKQVVMVP